MSPKTIFFPCFIYYIYFLFYTHTCMPLNPLDSDTRFEPERKLTIKDILVIFTVWCIQTMSEHEHNKQSPESEAKPAFKASELLIWTMEYNIQAKTEVEDH